MSDKQSRLNNWFLGLPEGRRVALMQGDRWMLADAAFEAGLTSAPAEPACEQMPSGAFMCKKKEGRPCIRPCAEVAPAEPPAAAGAIDAREQEAPELLLGWRRYEKARKLSPFQWNRLHIRNLAGENFDAMIDSLPEPTTPVPALASRSEAPAAAGAAQAVADLNNPAYDAYFGQVRKYADSLPRYIIWDSKHPDYPVEWTNPGRSTREGEHGFFRHDIVNELMAEAKKEGRQEAYRQGYEQGWHDRACNSLHAFLATPAAAAPRQEGMTIEQAETEEIDKLRELLDEVRWNCTRDDDFPDDLLVRIDKALDGAS